MHTASSSPTPSPLPLCSCSGSLTTYKELCSVASDMNQPDLIYKFLSLSTHHSVWNSKKVGSSTTAVCTLCAST